jgi:succinoglycan biosynthesis protein ExoO
LSPDVSVIIAAYNVEGYIEKSIKSVLIQADKPLGPTVEIIVVDDASTDKTWGIISQINDPRLQCLRLPTNSGPGAARNAAIQRASGRWVAILDGDDSFSPGRLARLIKRAEAEQADIAVDNLFVYREADGLTFPMFPPVWLERLRTLSLADFITGNQFPMGGYSLGYMKPLFSLEFLRRNKILYRTDLRIGEDYLLLAQALAAGGRCVVDPAAGYSYTARVGSTSYRLSAQDISRIITCEKEVLSAYPLSAAAAQAQRKRHKNLIEAHDFACLVEAIKRRNIPQSLQIAAASPFVVRHLWRPLWVRLQKINIFYLRQKGTPA